MRVRIGLAPLALVLLLPLSAQGAELDYEMPSIFYDGLNAKLINNGYREVRVTDPEGGRLTAFDPDGSEVRMTVNTDTGMILQSVYVHPSDG